MAYQGFLIKVGEYTIPLNMIQYDSYKPYISVQDLDSYPDANGRLHRTVVRGFMDDAPAKVEFNTRNNMTNDDFASLMASIHSQFTNVAERKSTVMMFIPEYNDYVTQEMYMPDVQPTINRIIDGVIYYDPIRLAFIGY